MLSLIFDMDDTLYERRTPFLHACNDVFGSELIVENNLLFKSFLRHGNEAFEDSMNGTITMEEMWVYRIKCALEDFQIEISSQKALEFQRAYDWYQHHIELTDTVTELFNWCKGQGIFLGIITNGTSKHQRMKFDALQLGRWIPAENLIITGDIGINKPDPAVFKEAERIMSLNLKETWYIGDSYEHDVAGAKAAGWNVIWLDKAGKAESMPGHIADFVVHTEKELRSCILDKDYLQGRTLSVNRMGTVN